MSQSLEREMCFLGRVFNSSVSFIVVTILNNSRYQVVIWFLKLVEFLWSITF